MFSLPSSGTSSTSRFSVHYLAPWRRHPLQGACFLREALATGFCFRENSPVSTSLFDAARQKSQLVEVVVSRLHGPQVGDARRPPHPGAGLPVVGGGLSNNRRQV